jgi:hypothetical protein
MGESFDKLMKLLKEKGSVSDEEIKKITDESGELSEAEHIEFSLAQVEGGKKTEITLEEYLKATKILDTAEEGSDEYKAAEKIADEYEKAN